MEILILKPKIKEFEKVVYNPIVKHQAVSCPEILRINIEDNLTRIDFIYYAKSYYENGGWVQIDRNSFIRPVGSNLKLGMVKVANITIAPAKHWFKSTKDILCYTLYFPPVPKGTKQIDIIEKGASVGTWFNFYGVSMERVRTEKLIAGN